MEIMSLVPESELLLFEEQIRNRLQTILKRRRTVFVDPKREQSEFSYDGIFFSKKYKDILLLILLSYFGDFLGDFKEYVRYEIGEYLHRNLLFPELNASLVSKTIVLGVLSYHCSYSPRIIFGDILGEQRVERVIESLKLKWEKKRRPVPLVYRRGYKDKGSLRSDTRWKPKHDLLYNLEHLEIEEKRQKYLDEVSLIVRKFGDLVVQELISKIK